MGRNDKGKYTPIKDLKLYIQWKSILDLESGCWIWTGALDRKGYGAIFYKGRSQGAHRVSYQEYIGDIPHGLVIRHQCDNPSCVNPNHLSIGTQKDNVQDMVQRKRGPNRFGERNNIAKLSKEDVLYIKQYPTGYGTGVELANKFNVCRSTISKIRCNINWNNELSTQCVSEGGS